MAGQGKVKMVRGCKNHTSLSPAIRFSTRPRGTTCAKSPSLNVSLLFLSSDTRRFSTSSGLKRPPARSLDKSSLRRSWARARAASSSEKSKGSSLVVGADDLEGDEVEEVLSVSDWRDLEGLLPFLWREGVVVKVRVER